MKALPVVDLLIIALYLVGMVAVGVYFSRKNTSSGHQNAHQFTTASVPGPEPTPLSAQSEADSSSQRLPR